MAQQDRLCLDTTNAPAEYAKTIDHRRMRVGTNQTIREGNRYAISFLGHHHGRQIFQIDLVHDTSAGGHYTEIAERLLCPAQQCVTLAIALILAIYVACKG